MKSSKWMIGLVAVVLMLALAPSSYAQIQIQLFNTPSSQEISTNRHANTADITSTGAGILVSGSLVAASSLTTTDLVLTFPAPITSGATLLSRAGAIISVPSTNDGIRIEGATGLFAAVSAIASVNYAGGTITVALPGFPPPVGNSISGSFRITGVRLDVNSKTAPLAITSASLSSSANNYIAPSALPTLISALGSGINTFTQGTVAGGNNLGTALMFSNQSSATPADQFASIAITEGFASAWRSATQTATTGVGTDLTNGSNILLTISGIPSGVTAALSRVNVCPACTQIAGGAPTVTLTAATLSSTTTTTVVSFTSTDLNAIETLAWDLTFSGVPATVPLTAGSITMTANMTPNGTGLTAGLPTNTSGYPRFLSSPTATVTVGTITSATTTLLAPFALRGGTRYDTGLAIANTTKDPFTTGGATQASGTLRFDLFPRTISGTTGAAGTQTTITTSGTVRPGTNGGGLDATGNLPAGGMWTATLSELMAAASPAVTGDFTGYIFIQANFVDAHGVSYILDNGNVSGTVPLLVLPPPAATSRNTSTQESLSF